MKEKIRQKSVGVKNDLIKFLREIIAIPSMNGQEEAVIQRIKEEMKRLGYENIRIDGLGNLFGSIGTGSRILAIDGHCDTVDIGNPVNWEMDPFKGDYTNGFIYGRGAADQKGGLASAIYAGAILKEIGIPKDMKLFIVASVLEEDYEGLTWEYIVKEEKIIPEAVMLTEPSELGIRNGQRGRMEMKVKTTGVSCHGSAPERGENAIYKMAPVISDIEQLNNKLREDPVLGKGTITITDIRSTAPSLCAVADSATIHLDRRLTKGETLEPAVAEVKNMPSVKKVKAEVVVPTYDVESYTGKVYSTKAYFPTWLLDEKHPLVQTAVTVYRSQFEKEPYVKPWVFSTNGVATMGLFGIPTIGFGPGEEIYAHAPNERIRADDLVEAVRFYVSFAHQWGSL